MGLLSSITVRQPKNAADLTDGQTERVRIVKEQLEQMKAATPMIGQIIGSLGDAQLAEIADFIVDLAHRIEAAESVPLSIVEDVEPSPDDADG